MSLLAPVSAPAPQIAQPRDRVAFASAAARAPVPAVTATLTQNAVQQAKAGARTDMLSTRDILPVTDKRHRLVGPPPTFQVNMLQHIRETRADPPEMRPDTDFSHNRARATDIATTQETSPPQPSESQDTRSDTFDSYQQVAGQTEADTKAMTVNSRM